MFDVARQQGSVDRLAVSSSMFSILCWVVCGCATFLWLPSAQAGTLYQCTGSRGETVYSSSKAGYSHCRAISSYADPVPRHLPPPAPPPPRGSLTGVTGSVTTTAYKIGADGRVPTSLATVESAVHSSGRLLGAAQRQRESLAGVTGSVRSSAERPLAAAAAGTPAQWSYRESHKKAAAPSPAPSAKVLRGAVYRIVRADGSVEYTNVRSRGGKGKVVTRLFSYIATCAACNVHSTVRWDRVPLNLTAYAATIRAASLEYGVDEAFLRAIIHAESAFNPRAMSLAGAQGLMQLMPGTASDMGVLDAFDSAQNIRGGARYLSVLLNDFDGNERLAAAAYNAGPGAVRRYKGVPPYAETQVYVQRVATLRKRYGAAIHPPLASRGPG